MSRSDAQDRGCLPWPVIPQHVATGAAMLGLLVEGDSADADRAIRSAVEALTPSIDPVEVTELLDALHVVSAWLRHTRGDLRIVGGVGRGASDSAEPLTAQELRVAHLAAYGLSNKDIGQRLYLSPRTVSGHLYRLFPKLGITSRAGLRDALQRRDDATARAMETG